LTALVNNEQKSQNTGIITSQILNYIQTIVTQVHLYDDKNVEWRQHSVFSKASRSLCRTAL